MAHLQDHMHAYYDRAVDGGLQDKEEIHYDDSQLSRDQERDQWEQQLEAFARSCEYYRSVELHHLSEDEMNAWIQAGQRVDLASLTAQGYAKVMQDNAKAIGAGAIRTQGFTTHATLPTVLVAIAIFAADARDMTLQLFLGGTTSGGTTLPQLPFNLNNPLDDPFQVAAGGVTIDVAGTLIFQEEIDAGAASAVQAGVGGFILPPNSSFYFSVTNNAGQPVTVDIDTVASATPVDINPVVVMASDVLSIEITAPGTSPIVCTLLEDGAAFVGETVNAASDDVAVATVAPASDVTDGAGVTDFVVTSVGVGLCNVTLEHVTGGKVVIPVRIL